MKESQKYPIEAFTLAMILFSTNMKVAMLLGITIVFADVLLCVLCQMVPKKYTRAMYLITAVLYSAASFWALVVAYIDPDWWTLMGMVCIGALVIKHQYDRDMDEIDYDRILFADAFAYAGLVFLGAVREYMSSATVMEFDLSTLPFVSGSYAKPMFGFIGAGLILALVNLIVAEVSLSRDALWVAIPALVLQVPFVWKNVSQVLGTVIGIATMLVVFIFFRKKLIFSVTPKNITGIPLEMLTLGMMYMIFSIL